LYKVREAIIIKNFIFENVILAKIQKHCPPHSEDGIKQKFWVQITFFLSFFLSFALNVTLNSKLLITHKTLKLPKNGPQVLFTTNF